MVSVGFLKSMFNVSGMVADLKSSNFSIYGQWISYLNIIFCLAFGIANIFHFSAVIVFSIIAIVQGLIILFIEVPFLLKICPLSDNFIGFVSKFDTNLRRALFYLVMCAIQWCSIIVQSTSLIVVAVGLSITATVYALGAAAGQEFKNSAILSDRGRVAASVTNEAVVRDML
ncbi:Tvp18 [Kluyveromyces lactis]|uniref:Golgi apparatus membrane protein TVP18 n=1 Tax=Kluyveromyces lactis (strain ATCC 8585 / CBS 2359 / DSM 70799 / NBRC 1267 / NRRL Y-1140 / WM37) TaxID=284590 RepID=TVP18_KLULA|nr:uncharacterized protein KLLA0_E18525g [Kluyveromyces lactis]Q6CMQ1.1 RecName: Full=Golgi apparatus membrane protein TVP18 [Kluyveromyces lactis NRRL Y-1140]QEU61435.1 Tvp18 [Kluyveromyces lactis]CAG99875.1 KLLA0E18525p [Kluyveromyces lactis]|eukprot:XP_454788.1 uncharacterized protein KLLA0_E18525g [Kluyveromyces lactis]